MRNSIIAAAFATAATVPVVAEEMAPTRTPEQVCAMQGAWASIIMGFRQLGTPLSEMISEHPERRSMIMLAYEYPRYQSEEMRDRAREDFTIDIEKLCFKAIDKK